MKSENFSGVRIVTQVAIEMRDAIIELAGNRAIFDSRALWLERAARAAGISARTAKALFYCESADPKSSVVEKIRAARAKKKAMDDAAVLDAATETYTDVLARISRLEAALRVSDQDFFELETDALCDMAGRQNQPLDSEKD